MCKFRVVRCVSCCATTRRQIVYCEGGSFGVPCNKFVIALKNTIRSNINYTNDDIEKHMMIMWVDGSCVVQCPSTIIAELTKSIIEGCIEKLNSMVVD